MLPDWRAAEAKVRAIAGDLPIYWGPGGPIYKPHVVASTMDAWSGEGMGYNVFVYPEGDGYMKPMQFHTVKV